MTLVRNWAADLFDKKQKAYNEDWSEWVVSSNYQVDENCSEDEKTDMISAGYSSIKELDDIIDEFPYKEEYYKQADEDVSQYEWEDEEKASLPCNQLRKKLATWLDDYFGKLLEDNKN